MATPPLLRALGKDLGRWMPRARRRSRRLQLVEALSLGERRTVAIISLDGREFLVGATPHSLALLSELDGAEAYPGAVQ